MITTDVITASGETDAEFAEMAFIERMQFAGGHVFTHSLAGDLAGRLPARYPEIRKQRNQAVRGCASTHSCASRALPGAGRKQSKTAGGRDLGGER